MKNSRNIWRVLTLALALVMLFSVVACGNNGTEEATTAAAGEETPTTAAKTEKPTEAPTTEKPTEKPTEAPTAEQPTEAPTGTPGGDDPVTPPVEDLTQPDVWDGTVDTSWFDLNNIQSEYVLTTAEQFAGFSYLRQNGYNKKDMFKDQTDRYYFEGVTIKLARDIILNEGTVEDLKANGGKQVEALNSNASFKGVFDGQGHTISGVYLDCTSSGVKALFGGLGDNSVIKNLKIDVAYFNGAEADKHTGAILAARANGQNILISNVTITNALMEESTSQFSGVGILLGTVNAGKSITLENCHTAGVISFPTMGINNNAFGGIVGYLSSGTAETTDEATGVVTPATTTTLIMKNCTSSATIKATNIIGGLVGKVMDYYSLTMDYKCKFTGSIEATTPGSSGEIWTGDYVSNIEGFEPTQPTVVEEFTGDDFSKLKFPEFDNATIVIDCTTCDTNSTVIEKSATTSHLYNLEGKEGSAANGVIKLSQKGVFHYYIDFTNVNNTIASQEGEDKKIASVDDCYIRWTFTVTEAGTYTIGSYMRMKNNADRKCMVQFDDQTPLIMHYTLTADEANGDLNGSIQDATEGTYMMWDGVEVYLEEGDHTLTYSLPVGSDAKTSSWHWRTIYLMKKAA